MITVKNLLLNVTTITSAFVLFAWIGTANAQEVNEQDEQGSETPILEEVIVTGQRYADILAIGAKRENKNVMEAVSQDDLGQLPDNNLGESIGRISGVSTVLDEGVGRYITIRGINPDLVNVAIDGGGFASTARTWEDAGRASNMEAISDDFIGKIEVYKSISADMDANSIGGTVNFVSKSAFDLKDDQKSFTTVDVAGGDNSSDDAPFSNNDINSRLKFSYLSKFGSNEQFGLTLSGSYKKEDKDVIKADINYWGGTLPSGEESVDGLWDTLIHEEGEKKGLTAKLEYMPGDHFLGSISVNYFDEDQEWNNGGHQLWRSGSYNEPAGTIEGWASIISHKNSKFGTDGTNISMDGDWTFNDNHSLRVLGVLSTSESYLDEPRFKWVGNWGKLNGSYARLGRSYRFDLDSASDSIHDDRSNYYVDEVRNKENNAKTDKDSLRADWTYEGEHNSIDTEFMAGLKWTDTSYDFSESYVRAKKYKGADHYQDFINSYDYVSPSASNPLLFGDLPALVNDIVAEYGSMEAFVLGNFKKIQANYDNAKDLNTDETVTAAYVKGSIYTERVYANFGIRFEDTDWSGQNRLNGAQDGEFVKTGGSYDHFLPSGAIAFDATETVKLRAAYSETLGRPGMTQYAAFESDPNPTTGVYYRSNPDLVARESENYDLSFEYYPDGGRGLFSVGYFYKDITNEIFDQQVPYQYDNGESVIESFYIQPVNSGKGTVSGFEFSLVWTSFDFLPGPLSGLGFRANYTTQDGELDILDQDGSIGRVLNRMPKAPETLANVAFTYDTDRFSARLAYQYMGDRTITVAGGGDATDSDDLVREATERWDLHMGYDVFEYMNVYLDVWNLTDATTQDRGYAFWDEETIYGRAYWVGVKMRW